MDILDLLFQRNLRNGFFRFLIFVLLKDNEGPENVWVLKFFVFFFLFPLGYSIYKIPAYAIEELRKKTQVSKWRFFKDKLVYDKDWSGNENNIGKETSLENWKMIQLDQDTLSGSNFCSVVLLDKYNRTSSIT